MIAFRVYICQLSTMASVYSTSPKHSYRLSHHSSLHIFAIYIAQNNKNIVLVLVYYFLTLLSTVLISGLQSLGSVCLSVSTISLRCFFLRVLTICISMDKVHFIFSRRP